MIVYDPACGPEHVAWLGLDEQLRIALVENFHVAANVELPDVRLHSTFHVIVENRIAQGQAATTAAVVRLMAAGVARHDAIHAVGSVIAELITLAAKGNDPNEAELFETKFAAAVARLEAKDWQGR